MTKLIKRLLQKPVELSIGRFRVTPLIHEAATGLILTGRQYQFEMKDEVGLWHKMKGVKRFSFDCPADGPAEVYVEYYDLP